LLTPVGGLIAADIFLNGHSIDRSIERFETLAGLVFRKRSFLGFLRRIPKLLIPHLADGFYPVPLILNILELLVSHFADGLYPAENIEKALKQAFGTSRSLLDLSHATRTGTRVGLPVATTDESPSCRIFTNYNGVGERSEDQGKKDLLSRCCYANLVADHVMKPKHSLGRVLLWEV